MGNRIRTRNYPDLLLGVILQFEFLSKIRYDVSTLLLRQRIDQSSLYNVYVLPNNTTYSVKSIRRDAIRSSTKELITPFENPDKVFCSKRRLFETPGLVESSSPEIDLFFDIKEHSEEEETIEIMTKTMEQYMSKTHGNY
nr:hypothetical protein [Tanacetum cinerariifolium]